MARSKHARHVKYRAHTAGPAITAKRVLVVYGENRVVDNVSFAIPSGKITAIIGPNGSGKTTLLKAVLGLIPVQHGSALFFGKPLAEMRSRVGYVPQRFQFDTQFPITVEEFLGLSLRPEVPAERIGEKLEEVGLTKGVADQLVGSLSGGQLQRVLIARAILNDPDLLVLDEPYAGIDIAGESTLYGILNHLNKEHGTTVVMVSHEIDVVAQVVQEVVCFNKTVLAQGSVKKTLSLSTLKRLYGDEAAYFGDLLAEIPCSKQKTTSS